MNGHIVALKPTKAKSSSGGRVTSNQVIWLEKSFILFGTTSKQSYILTILTRDDNKLIIINIINYSTWSNSLTKYR